MNFDITKIAHTIIYMLDNEVKHLNDKKLSILLFLIDYNHLTNCEDKIFGDEYIKTNRNPEPKILGDIFNIIANDVDLEEGDERLYLITELLEYLDIEIIEKKDFMELKFIKMEEEYDESLFNKDELKTINKIVSKYKNYTVRNIANATFKIDKVRETAKDTVII
ncbi:MAG: DUF4065 domain-containing protein [Campylobacteraceae bacterium]|nr:DUF4065 domain-containing protein [Campylobacteraceae bacterium]